MTRQAQLSGFLLSGFLFAVLGAVLPAWSYHLTEEHQLVGWLFLFLGAGIVTAQEVRRHLLPRFPFPYLCLLACALAAAAFLFLGLVPSPLRFTVQCCGSLTIGLAAGFLNVSLFESVASAYRDDPASTITRGGIYFGTGCLASAVAVAAAFRWGFVSQLLPLLAALPILFGLLQLRRNPQIPATPDPEPSVTEALREFSRPGALVFALLLLFQSGSEWTVADWLPLFLTHRLGLSPETALWMLALYWLALLLGRLANIYLLAHIRHGRILLSSAGSALVGCLLLVLTDNALGATIAIFLLGAGFAAVYPLLAEKMGTRFPSYHPGVFNSIFSLALAGGLLFPWAAGFLAQRVGLSAIMIIPATGTFLVVALLLVLWLESRVTGR